MDIVHKTKVLIFVFIILSFLPLIDAGLNINTEKGDLDFNKNVTIKSVGTGFVPYVGAFSNVDLGIYDLTADWVFAKLNWSYLQNVPSAYVAKIGGGPYLYNDTTTIYFNDTFGNNTYVPYTGATKDVNIGRYDFYGNATNFTGNISISVDGNAEILLDSALNEDSCLILQESNTLGFSFCYDGSGTNRWVVRNNDGEILFEIKRDSGEARIYNNTVINANLTVDDFIIGDGSYITNLNVSGISNSTSWNHSGTDVFLANVGDKVGIGTDNPPAKLSVLMNNEPIAEFRSNAGDYGYITVDAPLGKDAQITFDESTVSRWTIGNDGTDDSFIFRSEVGYGAAFANSGVMKLSSSGDVWINRSLEVTENLTAYMGNFTDLYVSNATLYLGDANISSVTKAGQLYLNIPTAYINSTAFVGDGSKLTNISFENGSANFNGSVTATFFNSSLYYGGNFTGDNITGNYFCNATDCYTLPELVNNYIQRYTSGNFTGSLYTTGANSSASNSNSIFQVISPTRGTPQFQVQDDGSGQASLMVRSWIVVNQNNTLLNSSQNNLCEDWGFEEIDCNTSETGADFGVTDDLEVLNLIHTQRGIHTHTYPGGAFIFAGNGDQYSGSNGSYYVNTDLFCDTTDSPFLDTGGWIEMIAEGTMHEGMIAEIDVYANTSCIYLKSNPGWNHTFSGVDYKVINNPNLVVLDGGLLEYYVGDNSKSQFKIEIPNGTGFTGMYLEDIAGADQHQGFTIDQDIDNYAGIVGFNIFASSRTMATIGKDYHLQTLEVDTSNINTSGITYIGALQFGEDIDNDIDFLHLSGDFNNIIKSGSLNVLIKAYYDNTSITTDVTTAFNDAGTDVTLFEADDSIIYIGATTNFTTVGVSLSIDSSTNIGALYYYCNSTNGWETLLGVTDTTNGMKTSGTLHWINPIDRGICNQEIDGTPFTNVTNYTYIAIQRTRNFIVTPPVENLITISGGGNLMFLRDDYMKLNPVDTAPETCSAESLGGIYYDISEDNMCVCKTTGWKVMEDGTACT